MTTAGEMMEGGRSTFKWASTRYRCGRDADADDVGWGAESPHASSSRKHTAAGAASEFIIVSQRRARGESDDALSAAAVSTYAPPVGILSSAPLFSHTPVTPARDPQSRAPSGHALTQTNVPLPFSRRAARPQARCAQASRVAPRRMATVRSELPPFRLSRLRTTRQ